MSDLVPSPFAFDGENFPVFRMPNGDFGLPLSCLTAPIDISADAQRRLVERAPWSKGRTTKMVVQVPGDTQARKHFRHEAGRLRYYARKHGHAHLEQRLGDAMAERAAQQLLSP